MIDVECVEVTVQNAGLWKGSGMKNVPDLVRMTNLRSMCKCLCAILAPIVLVDIHQPHYWQYWGVLAMTTATLIGLKICSA